MRDAYPLQWPMGRNRTPRYTRKGDPFHMPSGKIRHELARELKLMGSDDFVISSNLMVRNDGLPYANQKAPEDPGIALYFTRKGQEICISCDQYSSVDANLRAIGKTVEAIRGIERWGTEEMMDAAFTGFAALPAGGNTSNTEYVNPFPPISHEWHEVLQVLPSADIDVIRASYRKLASKYHPDNTETGDAAMFTKVQDAWNKARELKGE